MTELMWEGKYLNEKKVAPVRIALPFQNIETVNESAQDRQRTLDLLSAGRETEWRNRLIWGDKKYVLPSLLPEFAGKVNLIYIDPPFDTGADFSYTTSIPDDHGTGDQATSFVKEPSILEQKAYRDTWGRGLDSYLEWFYETAILLDQLLVDNGSLYVHLDWHVGHYAKAVLDEIFGSQACMNEIVWKRTSARSDSHTFNHIHDVVYFYARGEFVFNDVYVPHEPEYIASKYVHTDAKGRRYRLDNITSPNPRPRMMYVWRGHKPPALGWRYSKETMQRLHDEGRIWYPTRRRRGPS
jgi:adenine-specific DNA-methyltransferase